MDRDVLKMHRRPGYADPAPYPPIKVLGPNPYYAELLMDDYAGMVSEFTAISQYLYHHFYFHHINKELGELLENVSITEMLHMEMLAETIIKLGGTPLIRGSFSTSGDFWKGTFVYYGTNVCEQLQADLNSEFKAIDAYSRHIRCIGDPNVKLILQRIILDEKVHVRLFKNALRKFCGLTYPF